MFDEEPKSAEREQALSGGNMGGAVRVGATVRKPTKRQSATVRRLLTHVRAQGVTWVPEPLGTDEQGRDVWSFIPGDAIHDQPHWLWSTDILTTVAKRLREWHDATASFERRAADVWWWRGKRPAEVICHVDFAPYNHVFVDERFVGAIDFDICYPGPRLWDLAYTAYRYLPLTPHVDESIVDGSTWGRTHFMPAEIDQRLNAFLDAYAGDAAHLRYAASALLGHVPPRLIAMAHWCGRQESEALVRNGLTYQAHAAWLAGGARGPADVVEVRNL
ncbi:MAG: aminoglycoside phosphotransferase family protein [Myxococcales bacterium]|nr:MAG: aminoglycoside phosphotransferase family protein [Myxococcales bacterium]